MVTGLLPSLGGLALAQSQGTGAATGIVIAAVGVLLAGIGFWRSRALGRELAASRKQRQDVQDALKAAQTRERELVKKAEERHDEGRELKQEVAGLRKKNHAAQEELKAMRDQLKAQAEERDRLLATRPAFEAPRPEAKPKPRPATRPEAAPRVEAPRSEPAKAEPVSVEVAAPGSDSAPAPDTAPSAELHAPEASATAAPAADPAVVADLTARVAKLEADHREAGAALAAERETVKNQRNELARLRKYAEQLRRIDMVSKGKVEILEDRVASLGRQYYETVSELAALKGQVRPPSRSHDGRGPRPQRRPRDERGGQPRPEAAHVEPEAHPTPDSDSLAAEMAAADAEAEVHHEEVHHDEEAAAPAGGRTPTGTEV